MSTSNFAGYFGLEKQVLIKTRNSVDRAEIISQFTNGHKSSLKDLSEAEYSDLLKWMRTTFKVESDTEWQNSPENKMRRKIIGYFKSMHYLLPSGAADLKRINKWCTQYSITKKELNANTKAELTKIISQVEIMYKNFLKSLNK